MNKISKALFLMGVASFPSLSSAADYFSCKTIKGQVSLKNNANQLIYEMINSSGKVFSFSSPGPIYNDFLYNHYSRFQTDYLNVSFNQYNYKYTVFSNYEDGKISRGVTVVSLKTKREYTYKCNDEGVDKLLDLTKQLQCNQNSSLGC